MRAHRVVCVVAMGHLLSSASLHAEGSKTILVASGKPQKIKFGGSPIVNAGILREGDTREVESRISEVKIQPGDESLRVEWAGSELRFTAQDQSEGREYTAVLTYKMTLERATRVGNRMTWRPAGLTPERTASVRVGVLLTKLPETILTRGATQDLPVPGNIVVSKATTSNIYVAAIDDRNAQRPGITGRKTGKATLKVKYSLLGKDYTVEGKVEVLERGIQVPMAAFTGAMASLRAEDVAKIAKLEGKFLSLPRAGDPRLCRMSLEEDAIRVSGLNPGITSAVLVYGSKNKERIRVEIRITVEMPRSG